MDVYRNDKILRHIERIQQNRPVLAHWDITNRCNLECSHCSSRQQTYFNSQDEWNFDDICRVAQELWDFGVRAVVLSGGGEPLIHVHFLNISKLLLDIGFEVGLITNGILLDKRIAETVRKFMWVRVSIDERDDFDYALLATLKQGSCVVGASFVITPSNIDYIIPFALNMKKYGFDNVRFTPMWTANGTPLLSVVDEVKRKLSATEYLNDANFRVFTGIDRLEEPWRPKECNICYYSSIVVVIAADGNLYWCCAAKNFSYSLIGNIKQGSFANVWQQRQSPDIGLCPPCWMDNKNMLVEEYLQIPHANFV